MVEVSSHDSPSIAIDTPPSRLVKTRRDCSFLSSISSQAVFCLSTAVFPQEFLVCRNRGARTRSPGSGTADIPTCTDENNYLRTLPSGDKGQLEPALGPWSET